ncbi:response regulator [Paenibacillus flagellatus]|uniref:DNA-binding response regulator n=1 Tax=Paenibacillus flagellatus TaxID=2211139 RepID=A0A2V5K9R6_9BACL|nr:response regulator [Paenibacillus flagellatus]PYI56251.1 hypothetical protein DLM86_04500 [Paenibacillus flagellatus]
MHRILIVDDEPLLVNSLQRVIRMSDLAVSDIAVALSGSEALAKLQSHNVDIVLSDIRMPEMDGIELIRQVHERWPCCKVIFLTGFSQFDYAQKAVQYGAFDYLLKPVSDRELLDCIDRAIRQRQRETEQLLFQETLKKQYEEGLAVIRQTFLRKLLAGDFANIGQAKRKMEKMQIGLDPEEPTVFLFFRIDGIRDGTGFDEDLCVFAIRNIAEEFLNKPFHHCCLEDDNGYVIYPLQPVGRPDREKEPAPSLESIAESIQESLAFYSKIQVTMLVSDPAPSVRQWPETYRTAVSILRHSLFLGTSLILDFQSFDFRKEGHVSSLSRLPSLHTLMESGREREFRERLRELFGEIRTMQDVPFGLYIELFQHVSAAFIRLINKLKPNREQMQELDLDLDKLTSVRAFATLDHMEHYFLGAAERLFSLMNQSAKDHVGALVAKVKLHVENRLSDELSLTALADHVHVSAPYLSKLFKQHTGEGINEYVTHARIMRAKELLRDPQLKVYEVAAKVGYDNIPYFTKVFKKVVGVTPQEFKSANS